MNKYTEGKGYDKNRNMQPLTDQTKYFNCQSKYYIKEIEHINSKKSVTNLEKK